MKKFIFVFICIFNAIVSFSQNDTTVINLDGASIVSFQRNTINTGSLMKNDELIRVNYGQEPSNIFKSMPSIISLSDNGTEFGYGYFRIRGLDQTRINVNLDGCPWNEAEDFGSYFANSPDLLSSMNSVKVERGTSASYNGTAGSAGGINLESIDVFADNPSYAYIGGGSFGSNKITITHNAHNNKWGFHIKATASGTEGYRDYGFNDSKAITGKIGYKFNPYHTIDFLTMNGYHKNGQGWIGNTMEELSINPRANGNTKEEDDNWFMSMNRFQYRGRFSDNITFVSSLYYQYQDGSYRMDLDNYMSRMVDENIPKTNVLYDYGLTHHMIGANAMVKVYFDNIILNTGVNAYNYNRKHFSASGGKNVPEEELYSNRGNKIDASSFASICYKPFKNFSMTGNIQYRFVDFSYVDEFDHSLDFNSDKTKWNFVNFGFNAEYNPINAIKAYARYNRVNREPTRSDMFGGNEYYIGELTTTTPEIANDVEMGIESFFDKITFNINFFNMWFNNEFVLNGNYGVNGLPCHENADKSFRRGIEVSADWGIFANLHFDNNASFSQNRVITPTFGEKSHILAPSTTWDSNLSWNADKWLVGLNFNYRSSMFVDMENQHSIPCSYTINCYGNLRFANYELGLYLNNITNRINYCTGTVGADNKTLYFAMARFNFMTSLKIYF